MCAEACAIFAVLTSSLLTWCDLCRVQTLVAGQSLNDDHWHSLYVKRLANVLQLGVDSALQSTGELLILAVPLWLVHTSDATRQDSFLSSRPSFDESALAV